MKIVPIDIIKSMSGKICQHSDMTVSRNSYTGRMHTSKLCNPYQGGASEKQIAQQVKFGERNKLLNAWLVANRPDADQPKGSEAYRTAKALQRAYGVANVRGIVNRYMDAAGNVKLPALEESVPVVPQGGGGTGGTEGGGF